MNKILLAVALSVVAAGAFAAEPEVTYRTFRSHGETIQLVDRTGDVAGETVVCQQFVKNITWDAATDKVTFELADAISRSGQPGVYDTQGKCPL